MVKRANSGTIMDILAVPESQRTPEHIYTTVEFVMSAWETAHQLGHKRTAQLFRDFKHINIPEGEKIIVADDQCSLFYIIVAGEVVVEKRLRPHITKESKHNHKGGGGGGGHGSHVTSSEIPSPVHQKSGSSPPPQGSRRRRDRAAGARRGSDHHDSASVRTSYGPPCINIITTANQR